MLADKNKELSAMANEDAQLPMQDMPEMAPMDDIDSKLYKCRFL